MKKIYIPLIALLACTVVSGQGNSTLKLNLEKNRIYRLHSGSEQTIVQTVNGNQQTIESTSGYTVSIKMVDSTPAFMVTEVRFDTIASKSNTMGRIVSMSSATEGDIKSQETSAIMSWFMNRMTKSPVYAKIDYTGKVTEIVNAKMISDMILRDTSLIALTGPAAQAVKGQAVNMFSEGSYRSVIEMFLSGLPAKEVTKGDTWEVSNPLNAGGMNLEIKTIYKLEEISGNSARMSAESSIRPALNALPMESGGARITYDDLKGVSKSEISLDTATGLTVSSESRSHIAGNLGVSVAGMSMTIPMDISGTSKVNLLK